MKISVAIKSSSQLQNFLFSIVFLSAFLDPGSTLGIRNLIFIIAIPLLLFLCIRNNPHNVHYITSYVVICVLLSIFLSFSFRDIDLLVASSYWFIILSLPLFLYILKRTDLAFRFKLYRFSCILFLSISFIALLYLMVFPPPFSGSFGPIFLGLNNSFVFKGFIYHGSFLYIFPLMCLSFCRKPPSSVDLFLILFVFLLSLLASSAGGIVSSVILFVLSFNKLCQKFVVKYSHYILIFGLIFYFLFLSLMSAFIDPGVFQLPREFLSSTEVKIGHFISFVDNIDPFGLLFGEGPGSLFSSISKEVPVLDIELSPVEVIRKFGLIFYSLYILLLYQSLKAFSASDKSLYYSLSVLFLVFNSFWNPLFFGFLSVIILSEFILFRTSFYLTCVES